MGSVEFLLWSQTRFAMAAEDLSWRSHGVDGRHGRSGVEVVSGGRRR